VPYTKTETEVVVDLASKVLVERDTIWVEVGQVESVQTSLNVANEKINDLSTSLNTKEQDIVTKDEQIVSLNSKIETLENEKNDLTTKFNEQTDVLVNLNSKIKDLEPIVERYNTEQYEKSLNAAMAFYKEKFESVNALDEFEKDETVELIKKSINSSENESIKAKFALNELIVSNLKSTNAKREEDAMPEFKASINSTLKGKENKDLIETEDIFERTYGFKKN
jgi:septal ring factor EnvC (AmiA/AmiB activator)